MGKKNPLSSSTQIQKPQETLKRDRSISKSFVSLRTTNNANRSDNRSAKYTIRSSASVTKISQDNILYMYIKEDHMKVRVRTSPLITLYAVTASLHYHIMYVGAGYKFLF